MMEITVNGNPKTTGNVSNINELLIDMGYGDKLVAVAINGAFIVKSSYNTHTINNQDNIEIVAPMQGG